MDASSLAAWWGAGIATLVAFWDAVNLWRAGPNPILSATGGMVGIGQGVTRDKRYIMLTAQNRGERATTLTNVGMASFTTEADRRARKVKQAYLVVPTTEQPLPHFLPSGAVWQGFVEQPQDIEEELNAGLLEVRGYFSHSDAPTCSTVAITKQQGKSDPEG